jgi:hypothetical protein
MTEPENLILQLLRGIREDMTKMEGRLDAKMDNHAAELRSVIQSLRADVAADFLNVDKQFNTMEKRLNDQIVGLRRAVMEYHSSAVGHGMLLSEFEERLRRVEQRLDLLPPDSH